jgi:hypothetical protein
MSAAKLGWSEARLTVSLQGLPAAPVRVPSVGVVQIVGQQVPIGVITHRHARNRELVRGGIGRGKQRTAAFGDVSK